MTRSFVAAPGWGGSMRLDVAVAAFAASSLAFVIYAMPAEIFSALVARSGLPALIAAAEPPLGMKARIAVMAVAGLLCFAALWALLRALEPVPAKKRRYDAVDVSQDLPRVRRGDAHPDAPPRRPLFAGHDLGEPADFTPVDEDADKDWGEAEAPLVLSDPIAEEVAAEVESASDLPPAAEAGDESVDAAGFFEPPSEAQEEAQELHPFLQAAKEAQGIESLAAPLPEAGKESVSDLMQRLEGGLARRETSFAGESQPAPPSEREGTGHRLRSAINDLERMAKRG